MGLHAFSKRKRDLDVSMTYTIRRAIETRKEYYKEKWSPFSIPNSTMGSDVGDGASTPPS